jgi:hypothetical protein
MAMHVDGFSTLVVISSPLVSLPDQKMAGVMQRYHHHSLRMALSDEEAQNDEASSSSNTDTKTNIGLDPRLTGRRPPSMLRNEFCRTFRPSTILSSLGGDDEYSNSNQKRQFRKMGMSSYHTMTVAATREECDALAGRFDLSHLESLSADVTIRPSYSQTMDLSSQSRNRGSRSSEAMVGGDNVVDVEGTIHAQVQQVCVRTGDSFDVDVEFPFFGTVYPISSEDRFTDPQQGSRNGNDDDQTKKKDSRKKKTKRPKNASLASSSRSGRVVVDLKDVFDLQAAIEASEAMLEDDDGFGDIDTAATAIPFEDEAIYCTYPDLVLDVGELVAQSFYTQLDPYPVKDKTRYSGNDGDSGENGDPVELYSITG